MSSVVCSTGSPQSVTSIDANGSKGRGRVGPGRRESTAGLLKEVKVPYPRWVAHINKRLFNPREVRRGKYPVVTHIGRSSGKSYETPLDAYPTNGGYVLVARYGSESDWVKNILTAGTATLRIDGDDHALASPRLVNQAQALGALASDPPKNFTKAQDFVLMDEPSAC